MDARKTKQRFVELMSAWLVSLPFDLKILFEAADNENLSRETRELVVGAIIYVVSPNDFIADRHDSFVSYCDDCLLMRLALQQAFDGTDEDTASFKGRFPEFFDDLADNLAVCRAAMGDLFDWLASKVEGMSKLEYKGKKVIEFLDDLEASELLYEDGLGFGTEYPVEEDTLADRLKKASTILEFMRRRKAEEARLTA